MKLLSKKLLVLLLLFAVLMPAVVSAQDNGLVPCGGKGQHECNFDYFLQLIDKIIDWIIKISVPVAAGVFAWAGFQMMLNANNPGKRQASIEMIKKVAIGLAVILAAWIIVSTLIDALLKPEFRQNIDLGINNITHHA